MPELHGIEILHGGTFNSIVLIPVSFLAWASSSALLGFVDFVGLVGGFIVLSDTNRPGGSFYDLGHAQL